MNAATRTFTVAMALALAPAAMAQTVVQPLPHGAKYRDQGAKPATGRAGLAAIEARALLDRTGRTDIEVTTGRFEGIGGGGNLEKVQVKLFSGGALVETDNYRQGASGVGTGTYSYDGLNPGYTVQVQANVGGLAANRTDVVTVTTPVKRRPDLEAMRLSAQSLVVLNAPVTIRGVVAETNGHVGARATCSLLADGVEIGRMQSMWIDAGTSATCEFRKSFATVGRKNLTLRVTDVEPRDYDGGNNEASFALDVAEFNVHWFYVDVFQMDTSNRIDHSQTYRQGGVAVATYTEQKTYENHFQALAATSGIYEVLPRTGRITYRHTSGGVALPSFSIAVQDLPDGGDPACRYAFMSNGMSLEFCAWDISTTVAMTTYVGSAVYVEKKGLVTSTGQYDWSEYSTYSVEYEGSRFALGADYTAELLHETGQGVYGGSVGLPLERLSFNEDEHSCVGPADNGQEICHTQVYRSEVIRGAWGS